MFTYYSEFFSSYFFLINILFITWSPNEHCHPLVVTDHFKLFKMLSFWIEESTFTCHFHENYLFSYFNKYHTDYIMQWIQYIGFLTSIIAFNKDITCLQRLHLFQWVHLLPQLLNLSPHIVILCRCSTTNNNKNNNKKINKTSQMIRPNREHIIHEQHVTTSRLTGWNSFPCARWTAAAEQGEAENKKDWQCQMSHVWEFHWRLCWTLWHGLFRCEGNQESSRQQ